MSGFNLKRRRPFGQGDESAEAGLPYTSRYTPSEAAFEGLPQGYQDSIENAASIYGLTGSRLHQLAIQEQSYKRQKITSEMPTLSYVDGPLNRGIDGMPEEARLSGQGGRDSLRDPARFDNPAYSLTSSLGNLRHLLCQSCLARCGGHDGYEPLAEQQSFGYGSASSKPYLVEKPPSVPVVASSYVSPAAGPPQPSVYPMDDAALAPQHMQNYQSLQPQNRPAMAPPAVREPFDYAAAQLSDFYPPQQAARGVPAPDLSSGTSFVPEHVMPTDHRPASAAFMSDMAHFQRHDQPFEGGVMRFGAASAYGAPGPVDHESGLKCETSEEGKLASSGFDAVYSSQLGRPPARRGPFKNSEDREKTAQTRKLGSCVRCKMQRIRCEINPDDPEGECLTCVKVTLSPKIWRLPCLRYKITDVKLFKPGQVQGYEWTRRWAEGVVDAISNWASTDIKTIEVSEGYTGKSVKLRVREFIPQDGDRLERSWVTSGGVRKSVPIPPYALIDIEEAQQAYEDYIYRSIVDCFSAIVKPASTLLWDTYCLAWNASQDPTMPNDERELLLLTLRLWVAVRLTTKSTIIVGNERLGMTSDIMDDTSPIHGCIPLPPVLGAQLDLILIRNIQSRLRRELLEKLQKMTTTNKQKTWLTTYLVTFILLHNIALITDHDASYARKHGMKRRFAREDKVKEYHLGANILLAYFHYCNKGIYPFSSECRDQDLRALAELDETMFQFVRKTRAHATTQKVEWERIHRQNAYEDDYFFVSQMFEEDWKPRPTL